MIGYGPFRRINCQSIWIYGILVVILTLHSVGGGLHAGCRGQVGDLEAIVGCSTPV